MCFRKICESLNKFWKFYLKIWKFLKFFQSFKENVNKNFEKLNENYNFLLLSILIAGWGLGCSLSFAIVPVFRGGGDLPLPPPPGYAIGVHCTVYNETFQFSQSNANKMQLILTRISTNGGGKNLALLWHAIIEIISSLFNYSVCVPFPDTHWGKEWMR